MRQLYFILLLSFFNTNLLHAQVNPGPDIAWQQCYGGSIDDYFTSAIVLESGSVIATLIGESMDGDLEGIPFTYGWLKKYSSDFSISEDIFLANDSCTPVYYQIKQLDSEHLLLGGYTGICDGSFGITGDFVVTKIDTSGNHIWTRTYGGPGKEIIQGLLPTSDGGFFICGTTNNDGGDIPFVYPGFYDDAVIMKMDSLGEIQWVQVIGGSIDEHFFSSPILVSSGTYQIVIGSSSSDYDFGDSGVADSKKWMVRNIDSLGNVLKENFFSAEDNIVSTLGQLHLLDDGKTLMIGTGESTSPLNPTWPEHSLREGAIGIIDSNLELIEIFLYGGTGDDYFKGLIQAEDGGYFCYGYSNSSDQDLPGNHGDGFDLWVIKIDELYNLEWSKNVGSSSSEVNDYGALTASSNSLNFFSTVIVHSDLPNGDLACGTLGVNKKDAWLLSFDLSTNVINKFNGQQPLNTYPNPIIDQLFIENVTEELLELNLTIYNLNGVAVFSVNEYVKDTIHIDLSKLISGVYYFVYRSKDFFFSETKVIQKI